MNLSTLLLNKLSSIGELDWLNKATPNGLHEALRDAYLNSERNHGELHKGEYKGVWFEATARDEDLFIINFGSKKDPESKFQCHGKVAYFTEADGTVMWLMLNRVAVGTPSQFKLLERVIQPEIGFDFVVDTSLSQQTTTAPSQH